MAATKIIIVIITIMIIKIMIVTSLIEIIVPLKTAEDTQKLAPTKKTLNF